ncbi:protein SPT2 homolog isoform X2 [Scaptodrosophila lebanonensis]|uniref:Protein SPT2 homolog n=1 Tax=Drosophila lebanonensis TaxID=7225 RepID=A0A6J2TWP7_DROLE|nr:protein SPT2 homolog isoform X2 [Scaptodrosophila lebanonensis]
MDFGALLHYAKKKNDATTKDEGKFYSTKYAPPKKESKESKQLSNNIQKFLKKREAEEQQRKREEREKLSNLLAMRDEKSKNKIRKMLKVTKSANKSVLEDAKDGGTMDGPDHADGDDYGYVSTEANAFYQKYIEKVKDVKEDKGFAPSRPQSLRDLSGTKERVKAAITREREEAKTHTRQRSSIGAAPNTPSSSSSSKDVNVARAYGTSKTLYDPEVERREEERKKREEDQKKAKSKRPLQPPPMDFQALLRLAEKKQHEPVIFAAPEKKREPERLLSAREKRELEERQRQKDERARRERERLRDGDQKSKETRKENGTTSGSSSGSGSCSSNRMEPNGRIPKLNSAASATPNTSSVSKSVTPKSTTIVHSESKVKPTSDSLKRPATSMANSSKANVNNTTKTTASSSTISKANTAPSTKTQTSSSAGTSKASQSRNPYAAASKTNSTREFPPRDSVNVTKTRQFPPPDVRGRPAPPPRRPAEPVNKKRIYDDDEDEYDSELDDFIDDGDCEEDISSHIRDIFGYDKRRYRDQDFDDREMESSFAQMQREEFISKKLGLQEDLEDMRMEAEHKKRKIAHKRTRRISDDD